MDNDIKSCITAISKVVIEDGIAIYFQPVVSLLSKTVIGFEAFARGIDESGETLVSPACLFNSALPIKAQLKIEEVCLSKSLEAYKPLYDKYRDIILFLNINSNIYSRDEYKVRSPHQLAASYKYFPNMITLEMDAAHLANNIPFEMITAAKEHGYKISIDNVDGSAECAKILKCINPDFVKFDSKIYQDMGGAEGIKDELVTFVADLSRRGITPVAKGVEKEREAVTLAQAGFNLQQGYFYADSSSASGRSDSFSDKINRVSHTLRESNKNSIKLQQEIFREVHLLLKSTMTRLQQEEDGEMNRILEELIKKNLKIISAYILSASGRQLTKRFAGKAGDPLGMKLVNSAVGSDHSDSEIFIYLNSGFEKIAGSHEPDALCRSGYNYIAGFFYKDGSRRGRILILDYINS
ncbi:EAL domain-containing protein [Maridesulfovibrio sp.]|uniref:EAL domain-containing protein n=1 Tax=unclassified Maridesulfovibrio TaxID=2794999 RepID=UPI003B008989